MDQGISDTSLGDKEVPKERTAKSLRHSCEVCRASKGRCCPSREDSRRCQRCVRDGKQCVFLEVKPRPRRAKTSRMRVAEMEQKLEGIFSMLSGNPNTTAQDISLPLSLPSTISTGADQQNSIIAQQPPNPHGDLFQPSPPAWPKFRELQDAIGKDIISFDMAENLLRTYSSHAPNFPFVVIQPHVSLDSLRREKPFLLLSILTVSAKLNLQLQNRLETELRETLGRKVIVNCEKSLDLLQGLLIYLTWYHRYFKPEQQQIYQLSQMAIAMAVDLGISKPNKNIPGSFNVFSFVESRSSSVSTQGLPCDPEAMRTFLGCYYLSSCLSTAFRKPNNLKYTDYVEECCQSLIAAKDSLSDRILPYFIRLQRLAEVINTTFDYDNYQQLPALDAVRVDMLVKTFNKQLKQIEDSFPPDLWNNIAIKMAFLHIKMYVNEIGLHAYQSSSFGVTPEQTSCRDWYSSVARADVLVSCIDGTKGYIDSYLKLSNEEMQQNTIMEEIKIIYAIFTLGRFTSGVKSPLLDAGHLREVANFGHYMTALIHRMSVLITFNNDGGEQIDYFWHSRRIFQYTKIFYEEQVRGGYFTTLEANGLPDCADLFFEEILQMEPDPKHDNAIEYPLGIEISEDGLWTIDMLGEEWPGTTLDPREMLLDGVLQ